jgi:hypothetical protein
VPERLAPRNLKEPYKRIRHKKNMEDGEYEKFTGMSKVENDYEARPSYERMWRGETHAVLRRTAQ